MVLDKIVAGGEGCMIESVKYLKPLGECLESIKVLKEMKVD